MALDLMDAVFQWAGENGFRRIIATITKGNTRALRFYRKYGFDLADGASLDGPDDLIVMKEINVEQNAPDNADKPRV